MENLGDVKVGWDVIEAELPRGFRELAQEMGLIRPLPEHLGAKIKDIAEILRLVFQYVGLDLSLKTTTAMAAAAGPVTLSSVALHKWMRRLGPYLATLLAQKVGAAASFAAPRWAGYEVVVADASVITGPGSEGVDARLFYALRLVDFTLLDYRAGSPREGESLRFWPVRAGQLWIVDRIYANPPGIAAVHDAQGDVIVRYNRGALPLFDARGWAFDVLRHLRSLQTPGAMSEWSVRVQPDGHAPIAGRLCAVRLPEDKVEQARNRLRKAHGRHLSAEALEAAAWLVVFTTVPRQRLSTSRVLALYRLRWQVELEIKRDKSIADVDELPVFREDTIAAWLYAKLLLQQIARTLVSPAVTFPPWPDAATDPAPARQQPDRLAHRPVVARARAGRRSPSRRADAAAAR